jgi:hypothetical protein
LYHFSNLRPEAIANARNRFVSQPEIRTLDLNQFFTYFDHCFIGNDYGRRSIAPTQVDDMDSPMFPDFSSIDPESGMPQPIHNLVMVRRNIRNVIEITNNTKSRNKP